MSATLIFGAVVAESGIGVLLGLLFHFSLGEQVAVGGERLLAAGGGFGPFLSDWLHFDRPGAHLRRRQADQGMAFFLQLIAHLGVLFVLELAAAPHLGLAGVCGDDLLHVGG